MKPFRLEIEINNSIFSTTFKYDSDFIDFVKRLNEKNIVGHFDDLKNVDECQSYIRKMTTYNIVDFEIEEVVFNTISDALNSGLDINKLIERHTRDHRTLQQKFTTLCLKWIETVGAFNYGFDGRNECSHEQCEKITNFMKANDIYSGMPFI